MPITEDISSPGAGEYTTGAAQVPGTPTHVGSATNQISIAFTTGTNGSEVTYLIYVDIDGGSSTGYVQSDDGAVEAGESWATAATWGSIINVTGLTGVHGYKFKVAARNEALLPTIPVYSAFSTTMVPLLDLAYSSLSNAVTYECTTGNVKVSGLTVTAVGATSPGVYTIGYTLTRINTPATKANVKIAYGTNGTDYTNLTDVVKTFGDNTSRFDMTISSPVYSTTYTYDGTGTAPLFVTNGLTTGMMVTINSSTFSSANNGTFKVVAVAETYITVENSAGVAETNKVLSASSSMTSCISIGGDISSLTASEAGTANSNKWASCLIVGNSYANTIYIRVTPYDEATGGNAGDSTATTVAVDNRPDTVTIAELDGYSWDSDTTPEFVGNMASIKCGSYLYFVLHVYNSSGVEIQTNSSAEITDGWSYEADNAGNPGVWTDMTWLGVPAQYAPPNITGNRIKYVLQTALTASATYSCKMQQAEVKSELI
jgi:hypothetical protein